MRGNIGRNEVFVFAHANHGGRAVAGGDDLIGIVGRDHGQRKDAGEFLDGLANRIFQRGPVAVDGFEYLLDQMRDDFGVGFGGELVAFFGELLLQGEIFSTMPLWTTTILPVQSRCGCAFSSVGRPCVAQRVWPMP